MLNKIMMTGRITANLNVVTDEDYSYCKFGIAVDQPKRNGIKATPQSLCGVAYSFLFIDIRYVKWYNLNK